METLQPDEVTMCVIEQRTYIRPTNGITILGFDVIAGEPPEGFRPFGMQVTVSKATPKGTVQAQRFVPLETDDLLDAFTMAPEVMERVGKELEAEINKSLRPGIVVPGAQPNPNGQDRMRFQGPRSG